MRKGQFTIPNLVGVVVLLFIFAHLFPVLKPVLVQAAEGSGTLTKAVLFTLPAVILISILGSPFMLSELKFEREARRRREART